MDNLKNKKILLCVTGSIAAYKACEFIRLLKKQDCHVQVVMSQSSQNFIGKLTLASLSDNEVLTDKEQSGLEHVKFAIEYDAIIVLPATANILCKSAGGIADDIVSTVLSICEQPKLFVPAMNFRMWQSKATQQAVKTLKANNIHVMDPEEMA
jgi:phosphopantothenoylcysteine decarboxylase/phosphopantothenate--cysteine ligase